MSAPMGSPGSPFKDSIAGGGNLIVPFLQSPNYVPSVSGWRISRNGSAEFANVTTRGPLVVIDPNTGLVVASIGAAGNISGTYATITNDIILQGQSLAGSLQNGKGLVGFFGTFASPAAPGNGTPSATAWFQFPARGDRLYFISCTPLRCNNSNSLNDRVLQTQWSVTDTLGNGPTILAQTTDTVSFNLALVQGVLFAQGLSSSTFSTVTFALQSTGWTNGATNVGTTDLTYQNVGGWNMYAWDIGTLATALNNGGLGSPAGATQRTTQYNATASQSYLGSGAQFVDTDLWRSDFSDGKGATTSFCVFPGSTIRSDLTGATIQSATLSMYCTTSVRTNGSLAWTPSNLTAVPATQASFTSNTYSFDNTWPVPGWFSVNISGAFLNDIIGGSNSMAISSAPFGLAATRFAGASVANKPYITVTYTK